MRPTHSGHDSLILNPRRDRDTLQNYTGFGIEHDEIRTKHTYKVSLLDIQENLERSGLGKRKNSAFESIFNYCSHFLIF